MTQAATPSPLNYYIGKGIVTFKKSGEMDFRQLGNVPEFEITPDITKLDHFSSMSGSKTKDRSIVTEKSAQVRIVLEEWNAENLALALLGTVDSDTAGNPIVNIFDENSIEGELLFTGTNEVGAQVDIHLLNVSFTPSSALNPISDEWGQIEITGEMLAVNGSFGTVTVREADASSGA
jgi:hypothetical protein